MKQAVCALIRHKTHPRLFLGVTRRGTTDQWGCLGGKIEPGENPRDAIIREVKEEAGVTFFPSWLPCFELICSGDEDYLTYCFSGNISSKMDFKSEEGCKVDWVTREDLESGPFGEYNKKLFEKVSDSVFLPKITQYEALTELAALGDTKEKILANLKELGIEPRPWSIRNKEYEGCFARFFIRFGITLLFYPDYFFFPNDPDVYYHLSRFQREVVNLEFSYYRE